MRPQCRVVWPGRPPQGAGVGGKYLPGAAVPLCHCVGISQMPSHVNPAPHTTSMLRGVQTTACHAARQGMHAGVLGPPSCCMHSTGGKRRPRAGQANRPLTGMRGDEGHIQARLLKQALGLGNVQAHVVGVGCPVKSHADGHGDGAGAVTAGSVGSRRRLGVKSQPVLNLQAEGMRNGRCLRDACFQANR